MNNNISSGIVKSQNNHTKPYVLFQSLFGGVPGIVCAFTGHCRNPEDRTLTNTKEQFYRWPDQAAEFTAFLQQASDAGREAYFCAHALTEEDRNKAYAVPVRALWAEHDNAANIPPNFPAPTLWVESSPGKAHLYWLLNKTIDPLEAERINRRIAKAIGGDNGWHLTKLLRVPGTRNYKYADAPTVRLLDRKGPTYAPDVLDNHRLIPRLPNPAPATAKPSAAAGPLTDEGLIAEAERIHGASSNDLCGGTLAATPATAKRGPR
jgi:hypothetical protein